MSYDRIEDLSTVLEFNSVIKCMIIDHDKANGRIALSTKTLEPEPGDMVKNPAKVLLPSSKILPTKIVSNGYIFFSGRLFLAVVWRDRAAPT